NSIGSPPQPSLLLSLRQRPARFVSLAVRTRGDPAEFGNALVATMHEIDADTPLYWVRDYVDLVRDVTFGERVVARLFGVFGLVALALTAAGLYGVVAYHVGQRTREIGVRRALGAPGASVLRELFRRTGWQLAFGLVLGLGLGIPLTRLLTHALPSIAATSPGVIAGTLLVLGVAAMLAMLVPARRALRVAPLDALRYE
ncbi:MAG TPA: FtsX-like permease family protein, partial [Dokdonella sp.]